MQNNSKKITRQLFLKFQPKIPKNLSVHSPAWRRAKPGDRILTVCMTSLPKPRGTGRGENEAWQPDSARD
ncbi:MAG: hypothetical protein BWK78_06230 [Thiotrichaceae bacterium IS1]|nr:MAG: hypothetical protein BWK78_06230 [Thiotrichaceae bacterium IS1]